MKTPFLLGVFVFVAMLGLAFAAPPDDLEEVPLTLTGCVMAGEEDDSFLLTNVVIEGTTLAPANAFYRFNTSDGFEDHVGHRVQVTGEADLEDVDDAELRIEVEDNKRTIEVESERRTVEVQDRFMFGTIGAMKLEADIPTYKFKVDEIRRMAGNCASAPILPGR